MIFNVQRYRIREKRVKEVSKSVEGRTISGGLPPYTWSVISSLILTHDLDDAECGKHKENMKCLCVAYFSLGAMLPPYRPKFLCESCNE